jgi:peptide/nickel transport system substrate-binding protein
MHLRRVACGVFFFVLASTIACEQAARRAGEAEPVVARIGVPEADVSAPDIGFRLVSVMLGNEGLTFRENDGRAGPRLAESWTSSPDGLTWNFKLKSDVTFHDGAPFTAEAVAAALNGAISNRAGLALYPGLADVVSIEGSGPSDVVIKLRRRSTFLLEDLSYPITRRLQDKSTVGTGPFKTVSRTPSEVEMVRNESYHLGRPQIGRVVIRSYATVRTAWASLMRNEIDVLWDVSRDAVEFVQSSDIALYSYQRTYVYVVAFNNSRSALKETPVRRALNAAVDRDALIRGVLKGQGTAASGPLWPQHWAYDSSLRGFGYDASLASAILDAAGFKPTERAGGRRSRFTFTCILPEGFITWERIALDVQKQLYDIGVDMQLQALPADEFNKRLQAGDFDAAMLEMLSGTPYSRPYAFWHGGGEKTTANLFGYANPSADRWFEAIRSANGDAEYRVASGQLQRAFLDDPPALFLAWSLRTRAISRRFNVPVERGQDPVATFWRWKPDAGQHTNH